MVERSCQNHGDRLLLVPQHGTQSSPPSTLSSTRRLPAGHFHDTGDTKENGHTCVEWLCGDGGEEGGWCVVVVEVGGGWWWWLLVVVVRACLFMQADARAAN